MNKEFFKNIAITLNLEPKKEVLDDIEKEYNIIMSSLDILRNINIDNIKPLSHLNEMEITFDELRDDLIETSELLSKEQIFTNSKNHDNEFVKIIKVVK